MPTKNPKLVENFNAAVAAYTEDTIAPRMLVTHYFAAMRHGAVDGAEKQALTAAIFNGVSKRLLHYATPGNGKTLGRVTVEPLTKPLLDALATPEAREFLPEDASFKMAEIIEAASASAQKTSWQDFSGTDSYERHENYKVQITLLAEMALNYADIFAEPLPLANVETSKDIAPVRRITLKAAEGGQP